MSIDLAAVAGTLLDVTRESVAKNFTKSEAVLAALRKLGINAPPPSDDFDTIYAYALVEYGVFKPTQILNFFRNQFIREAFRSAFYEGKSGLLEKEANDIVQWNDETHALGPIDYDPRRELDAFTQVFRRIVMLARTPSAAEQFARIEDIHQYVSNLDARLASLVKETTVAQQIARDKPEFWEFLLTLELLRTRIREANRNLADLRRGLAFRPSRQLGALDFPAWAMAKMNDLIALVQLLLVATTEEIPSSWGPPGQPGDADEIVRAADTIGRACNALVEWETDLRFTGFPEGYDHLRELMQGWSTQYIDEIERIPVEMGRILSAPNPSGTHKINLVFNAPTNVDEFRAEIARMTPSTTRLNG